MSNSSLRNRLLRFLRPPLFLFSFSPSNEQLRRNWINLDGEKFRAEEGQPAKTLFRVAFRSKGSADGFRISDPVVIDLPVKSGTVTLSRPCGGGGGGGRKAQGGIIKIFHRCSISLRPGGAASKKPKASISRKLGRPRLEKVARSETAVRRWENEWQSRAKEAERENSGENGA